nr:regenerating islet-derived protein 3 alpha [Suncus murinus]
MLSSMAVPDFAWMLLSCLMLLSQVKGEDLQKVEVAPRIRCPTGSVAYGSYCYALFLKGLSWPNAELACQKRPQGHLVSVLTGSEAYFVASLIKNSGTKEPYIWIGLQDTTEGSQPGNSGWEWSSSDVLNYQAWDEKTPCTDPGYCGSLSEYSSYEKWVGFNCRKELPYVCKFKN